MENIMNLQEEKAAILKGIAHPVRIRIVEILAKREMCVCEIADLFDFDRTTISKHLSLMKDLGILDSRKDGLNVWYSLRMKCLSSLLSCWKKWFWSRGGPHRPVLRMRSLSNNVGRGTTPMKSRFWDGVSQVQKTCRVAEQAAGNSGLS